MWSFRLTEYFNRAGLQVAEALVQFIEHQALPGTDISAEAFWAGIAGLIGNLGPKNRELLDFYNKFDPLDVTESDRREYNVFLKSLEPEELKLLSLRRKFYVIEIENIGGLVSPVILDIKYADGKRGTVRMPAEIWKRNTKTVKKLVVAKKEITQIEIDPMLETADTDRNNNYWPPRPIESRFQLQKRKKEKNPMQKSKEEENRSKEQKNEKKKKSSGKD